MSALVLIASCLCANNFWPWFCLGKELRELKGPQSPLALKISIILNDRQKSVLKMVAIRP